MMAALWAVAAAAALTFAVGAAAVTAADQTPTPTVGGTLSAAGNRISVYSNGNVPAHVTMFADSVVLSETAFDIAPGQTHNLTFTGKAIGTVSATYEARVTGQETGAATLTLNLVPRVPEHSDWTLLVVASLLLLTAGIAIKRLRPWELRIARTPPMR